MKPHLRNLLGGVGSGKVWAEKAGNHIFLSGSVMGREGGGRQRKIWLRLGVGVGGSGSHCSWALVVNLVFFQRLPQPPGGRHEHRVVSGGRSWI